LDGSSSAPGDTAKTFLTGPACAADRAGKQGPGTRRGRGTTYIAESRCDLARRSAAADRLDVVTWSRDLARSLFLSSLSDVRSCQQMSLALRRMSEVARDGVWAPIEARSTNPREEPAWARSRSGSEV
jgi:hypothetical protein